MNSNVRNCMFSILWLSILSAVFGVLNTDEAKTKSEDLLNLIYNRYEMNTKVGAQFFLASNNIGAVTWNILKYKFLEKIVKGDQSFLMIFGGSSVTAGHDSYFNQSYPMIFQKRMKPIFDLLGINLIVHNIAQGANPCLPYTLCYEAMGGPDPDFVGWEQSYNCGKGTGVFELMARLGLFSANKAVTYYSASGAWSPSDCPPAKEEVPYCSEDWNPNVAGLAAWKPNVSDVQKAKLFLDRFNKAKPSASRFISDPVYNTWAHGFNVWEENPLATCFRRGETVNPCNGIDAAEKCTMKFMSREASVFGSGDRGADWHPTRAFHMLRGEAIAWLYTLIMLDAIYTLEEDLVKKQLSRESLVTSYHDSLQSLYDEHDISHHSAKHCNERTQYCLKRPVCHTEYQPHYSNFTLASKIVGKTGWRIDDVTFSEWHLKYGYLDIKTHYWCPPDLPEDLKEIHVEVMIGETNFIQICGALHHTIIYVDHLDPETSNQLLAQSVDISPIEAYNQFVALANQTVTETSAVVHKYPYIPTMNRKIWHDRKYIMNDCKILFNLPKGHIIVSLVTNSSHPTHRSKLSHLVSWP